MVEKNKKNKKCTPAVDCIKSNPEMENKFVEKVQIEPQYSKEITVMLENLASIKRIAIKSINNYSTICMIATQLIDDLLIPYVCEEKDEFESDDITLISDGLMTVKHELDSINEPIADVENSLDYIEKIFLGCIYYEFFKKRSERYSI